MQKSAKQLISAYAHWVIRWRWLVVIACLLSVDPAWQTMLTQIPLFF